MPKNKTPHLDAIANGPWPKFVRELREEAREKRMEPTSKNKTPIEYTGTLAETINSMSLEDLMFYDLMDNVSDQIFLAMEAQDLNRSGLAAKLNKSRAWATKVLAGDNNMTMKTLVNITEALGATVSITITPQGKG